MKRERITQIVLVIVGLFNLALIYFLYTDLRHSSWLLWHPKVYFVKTGEPFLIRCRCGKQ